MALVGVPDVTLGGTVRVRYNNFDAAVDTTIPIGSGDVTVAFATPPTSHRSAAPA